MLPRLLGQGRALDLLLSGRRFSAQEALEYGLLSGVVPRERLEAEALALLRRVLPRARRRTGSRQRAVHEGADLPLPAALALEKRLAVTLHDQP